MHAANPPVLRARFLVAMGLPLSAAVAGCVGEAHASGYGPYVRGREVCLPASSTQGGSSQSAPYRACRDDIFTAVHSRSMSLPCGPCSFVFNSARTTAQRRSHPDVCCYTGSSPSGPGRPLRAIDGAMTATAVMRDDWVTA